MAIGMELTVNILDADKEWADYHIPVRQTADVEWPEEVPDRLELSVVFVDGNPVATVGNPREYDAVEE